jgi:hypothetical protein
MTTTAAQTRPPARVYGPAAAPPPPAPYEHSGPYEPHRRGPVPPHAIDRERADNVLIADAALVHGELTASLLPTADHRYFGDRPGGPDPAPDHRVTMEISRAAAFLVLEHAGDRRAGRCFAIARIRIRHADPRPAGAAAVPGQSARAGLAAPPAPAPVKGPPATYRLRSSRLRDTFWAFDSTLGAGTLPLSHCDGRATILDTAELARLRAEHRRRRLAALAAAPESTPVPAGLPAPALVGRSRTENVFLTGPRTGPDRAEALLRVPHDHPVIHDPAYDHLPALALVDAALQLVHLWRGGTAVVREIDLRPTSFCETDLPCLLTLRAAGDAESARPPGPAAPTAPGAEVLRFQAVQGGTTVAHARILTAPTA